jgi:hypothetical protein
MPTPVRKLMPLMTLMMRKERQNESEGKAGMNYLGARASIFGHP